MNKIFYGMSGSFAHLKFLIEGGADFERIKECMPWNCSEKELNDNISKAKEELYLENTIIPSKAGKLLYD